MKGPRGNNGETCGMLLRRSLLAALVLSFLVPTVALAAKGPTVLCTDRTDAVHDVPQDIPGADPSNTGRYAVPTGRARGLVIFFHGIGHVASQWDAHLERVAREDGVIAVAMDYPGQDPEVRTWQVAEGARESNIVAKYFKRRCNQKIVVAYGVSMGGNASGLAVANSSGLYDWWFDIEGANNVIETYFEARAVAQSGNATATRAVRGIEAEMGGPFERRSDVYVEHTNVFRADDIVASGIKGIVMVHAPDDGLVPYDQSRELQQAIGGRLPVQFWTVLTSGRDSDTTIERYALDQLPEPFPRPRPLAGHSKETSYDSVVGRVGFDRLDALFQEGVAPTSSGEFLRDEVTNTYTTP